MRFSTVAPAGRSMGHDDNSVTSSYLAEEVSLCAVSCGLSIIAKNNLLEWRLPVCIVRLVKVSKSCDSQDGETYTMKDPNSSSIYGTEGLFG